MLDVFQTVTSIVSITSLQAISHVCKAEKTTLASNLPSASLQKFGYAI